MKDKKIKTDQKDKSEEILITPVFKVKHNGKNADRVIHSIKRLEEHSRKSKEMIHKLVVLLEKEKIEIPRELHIDIINLYSNEF